jgi:hypothetical protein
MVNSGVGRSSCRRMEHPTLVSCIFDTSKRDCCERMLKHASSRGAELMRYRNVHAAPTLVVCNFARLGPSMFPQGPTFEPQPNCPRNTMAPDVADLSYTRTRIVTAHRFVVSASRQEVCCSLQQSGSIENLAAFSKMRNEGATLYSGSYHDCVPQDI